MQINWCLKGIAAGTEFADVEAVQVMTETGIRSNWMRHNEDLPMVQANIEAQKALSLGALDDHVNDYYAVERDTPYISLSAGCREYAGYSTPTTTYPAHRTALEFATQFGTTTGYIYRCWVVTAPQIAADTLGVADEVRDLNLFADFYAYHVEGEIAAKLVVPVRQIQWVLKVGPDLMPATWTRLGHSDALTNPDFRRPQTIANLISEIS